MSDHSPQPDRMRRPPRSAVGPRPPAATPFPRGGELIIEV
ncbi:hypothetical protein BN903_36 [Halorubrum sp. AJ67]|nr:hypothetical protein BN903_36 [Halorubrum sp. AJ67]